MEYGVICKSEEALKAACVEHDLDHDDVYVISSKRDFNFALRETEDQAFTLILGFDWKDVRIPERDFVMYLEDSDE